MVVDAGPVVSLLLGDRAADEVVERLANEDRLRISVVNVAEVIDVLRRVHRVAGDDVAAQVGRLLEEAVEPVAVTRALAERAGDVRSRHYHHRHNDISLADCFAIATADPGETIATSDRAVARIARAEGIPVLALPNSLGDRP
jgi:uncharacterized protein with PIN domain